MNLLKRLTLVLIGVAASGCEFMHPPTAIDLGEEPVIVHAVLAAGSERAAVLLTRATSGSQPGHLPFDNESMPVSGAEILLISGAETIRLVEAPAGFPTCFSVSSSSYGSGGVEPAGPGCYAAMVPGGVRAGMSYRLAIRLPEGHLIHGEAIPPPAPTFVELVEPDAAVPIGGGQSNFGPVGAVRVRFDAPESVAGIGLVISGPVEAFRNNRPDDRIQCGIYAPSRVFSVEGADTASIPIGGVGCSEGEGSDRKAIQPDSIHARLYVTAYDAAFMRYLAGLQEEQVEPQAAAQGVSGALGLFAGEATLARIITLVPKD